MRKPQLIAEQKSDTEEAAAGVDLRRRAFTAVGVASLAASALPLTAGSAAAEPPGKAKIIFVIFRRPDLTHEQSMAEWNGARHIRVVRKVPGLTKWVQNHGAGAGEVGAPDGIGELWFTNAEAMQKAMNSSEMAAAGEDAKRFLDMEKTYAIVVAEQTVLG